MSVTPSLESTCRNFLQNSGIGGFIDQNRLLCAGVGTAAAIAIGATATYFLTRSTPSPTGEEQRIHGNNEAPSRNGVSIDVTLGRHPRVSTIHSSAIHSIIRQHGSPIPSAQTAMRQQRVEDPIQTMCAHGKDLPGLAGDAYAMFENSARIVFGCNQTSISSEILALYLDQCNNDPHFSADTVLNKVAERTGKARSTIQDELNTPEGKQALVQAVKEELDSWTYAKYGISSETIDHQIYELLPSEEKRYNPYAGREARHSGISQYFEALGLVLQRNTSTSLPMRTKYINYVPSGQLPLQGLTGEIGRKGMAMQTALPHLNTLFKTIFSLSLFNPKRATNRDIHAALETAGREMGNFPLKEKVLERVAHKMNIGIELAQWIVAFPENIGILAWAVGDAVDEWLHETIGVTTEQFNEADRRIYDTVRTEIQRLTNVSQKEMIEESMRRDPVWGQNNRRSPFFDITRFFTLILDLISGRHTATPRRYSA